MAKNKGEWSESYILLKIIKDNSIPFGDKDFKNTDEFIEISYLSTISDSDKNEIKILPNKVIQTIQKDTNKIICEFSINDVLTDDELEEILGLIKTGTGRAFSQPNNILNSKLKKIKIQHTKAGGKSKTDLYVGFTYQGYNYKREAVGLKSYLGSKPTLVNPTKATYFRYKVQELGNDINEINNRIGDINYKSKIQKILSMGGKIEFNDVKNDTYKKTLIKIDSKMPELLGRVLLESFSTPRKTKITKLVRNDVEEIHIKKYLIESLLSIFPSQEWDGDRIANGSIALTKDDKFLFYHVIKENIFKDFLFHNTKIDSPQSRKQTPYCFLYPLGDEVFIDLCLQVRFV